MLEVKPKLAVYIDGNFVWINLKSISSKYWIETEMKRRKKKNEINWAPVTVQQIKQYASELFTKLVQVVEVFNEIEHLKIIWKNCVFNEWILKYDNKVNFIVFPLEIDFT